MQNVPSFISHSWTQRQMYRYTDRHNCSSRYTTLFSQSTALYPQSKVILSKGHFTDYPLAGIMHNPEWSSIHYYKCTPHIHACKILPKNIDFFCSKYEVGLQLYSPWHCLIDAFRQHPCRPHCQCLNTRNAKL